MHIAAKWMLIIAVVQARSMLTPIVGGNPARNGMANPQAYVPLDSLHDLLRAAPDTVALDVAEMPSVEAGRLAHLLQPIVLVFADHYQRLLRERDRLELATDLAAVPA